jgi:hypothetical protein
VWVGSFSAGTLFAQPGAPLLIEAALHHSAPERSIECRVHSSVCQENHEPEQRVLNPGLADRHFGIDRRIFVKPPQHTQNNQNKQKGNTMKKAERKDFGKPDEVREFPKGKLELIKIGGATIGRAVFEPGWRWVTSVQPLAKTKSCEAPHFQYHVSGVLRIRMDDGTEFDCKPGDVSLLPSGHERHRY